METQGVVEVFKRNKLAWGLFYLNHHFRVDSPGFHIKILEEVDKSKYLAIAAPRESAKSTVLGCLTPLHKICYKLKRFIVIVQNTYNKACGSLETIKNEIRNNQLLREDFPIQIIKDSVGDTIFKQGDFETRVLCKGAEQIGSIRGEKFGAYRPDLFIIDDLEDDEMVKSLERRTNLRELYDNALVPAGDKTCCDYINIFTILHDDSLGARLVSPDHYPEYRKLLFKALNEVDGERLSLWPEKWSVEDLLKLQKDKPAVFAKEYQNDPASGTNTQFSKDNFRYWRIENDCYVLFGKEGEVVSRGPLSECKGAIACDLAWDDDRTADDSVVMPGFLTPNSDLLIDTYICEKGMRPNKFEEILFQMEDRMKNLTKKAVPIGFEKAKLEKIMKFLMKEAMRRRNRFLWFKELLWDGDKVTRIITRLQARYSQNVVYHRQGMGDLEFQLLRVPYGTHDDLADAAQGLAQLLEYNVVKKKVVTQDNEFEWWRKLAIETKKKKRDPYVFGKKTNTFTIKAAKTFR